MYWQQQPTFAEGLMSGLLQGFQKSQAKKEQQKQDQAYLDAYNNAGNIQLQNPNDTINTNYDTIQQLTNNPTPQASEFKNGNIPDAKFLAEFAPDYNTKAIDTATKNIQGLLPGWQAYKQVNPAQYKTDIQAVVDNNGNNNAGLLSGLQGIAKKYGTGGTFGNDVQYLANQTGDQSLMDATKTQQQPELNEKPTINVTPQYIKNQVYSHQAEILKKLSGQGINIRDAIPLVKQMLDDRVTTLTDQQADKELTPLQSNLDTALDNANDPQQKTAVMKAVMQYNAKAHQYGRQTLDAGLIKYALESNDAVIQKEDNGAQYRYVMTRKDGRPFGKDAQGNPIYQQAVTDWNDKQVSPDTVYNGNIRLQAQANSIAARGSGGSGGGYSGRGSSGSGKVNGITAGQYNSALGELGKFNKWQQDNPQADGMEYPYKEKLWRAQEIVNSYSSGSSDGGNNDNQNTTTNDNPEGAAWYDQQYRALESAHPDWTPEQITETLTAWINGG